MSIHKKALRALTSFCAAAVALTAFAGLNAAAAEQQVLNGYFGDLDSSGAVDEFDVILMDYYLVIDQSTELVNIEYADLDHNGIINAVDLTLLKRVALGEAEPEGDYTTVEVPDIPDTPKSLIAPPVEVTEPSLPCTGEQKILMVAVEFPDVTFEQNYSADDIAQIAFGPADTSSSFYPLESITAYYDRASYGRLHLTGDVYTYTAKNVSTSYITYDNQRQTYLLTQGYAALLDEVLGALDSQINYKAYDGNSDKYIDTVVLALPGDANTDLYWPCSGSYVGDSRFDGMNPGNLCIGAWSLTDRTGFISTWVHELGHAMGLPDYYIYANEELGTEQDEGFHGDAGAEMMDEAMGDMCALDKLMYGWYSEDEVQVYSGGTQSFTLRSSQQAPSCLLIPRTDINGYLSEYFLIESVTPEGNNTRGIIYDWFGTKFAPLFQSGGIRILHCNTETYTHSERFWGMTYEYTYFKWEGFSDFYDLSNERQRFVRLVNDGNGFFGSGDVIDSSTSGFVWYDANGYPTEAPPFTLTVESIENGTATVTVAPV